MSEKIKFIKENDLFSWKIGDVEELDDLQPDSGDEIFVAFKCEERDKVNLKVDFLIKAGYAEYIQEDPKKLWEPEDDGVYYAIQWDGGIEELTYDKYGGYDKRCVLAGEIFETKEKAISEQKRRAAYAVLKHVYSGYEKGEYCVIYDIAQKKFVGEKYCGYITSEFNFANTKDRQSFIDTCTEELKVYFGIND